MLTKKEDAGFFKSKQRPCVKKRNKKMNQIHQDPGRIEEIGQILEPLIRKIIREELSRLVKAEPGIFYLDPHMPLYQDMEDILQRKTKGHVKLHSHDEVWGD